VILNDRIHTGTVTDSCALSNVFIHAKVDKVDNSVMTAIGYFEQR